MKYKAVCFDVDGTLYPRSTLERWMSGLWLRHPVLSMRYGKTRAFFRSCQSRFEDMGLEDSSFEEREAAMYGKLYNAANAQQSLDDYYRYLKNMFCRLGSRPETQATLRRLKENGVAVAVFSDWPLYGKLEQMGVGAFVDCRLCSGDCGYLKPDARCFVFIAGKLRLDPSEILYVGDSYDKDIAGAHGAGMDAVLVGHRQSDEYSLALEVFRDWHGFDAWITGQLEA